MYIVYWSTFIFSFLLAHFFVLVLLLILLFFSPMIFHILCNTSVFRFSTELKEIGKQNKRDHMQKNIIYTYICICIKGHFTLSSIHFAISFRWWRKRVIPLNSAVLSTGVAAGAVDAAAEVRRLGSS